MREVEISAGSIELAKEMAAEKLGVSLDKMEIEVLQESTNAFLGIFGGKEAIIRAVRIEDESDILRKFLEGLLDNMGIEAAIEIISDENALNVNLSGNKMGILIGHRGETLDALQYLSSLALNRQRSEYRRVIIDTENYRKKREETLRGLARKLALKVTKIRRKVSLEPMNPYERRIIHSELQEYSGVSTHSEGDEPYRKVVITLQER